MSEPSHRMLVVYDGRRSIGHILSRGKTGFEAFDHNDVSLGLFSNEHQAANAVTAAGGGES